MVKKLLQLCVPIGALILFISLNYKDMTDFVKGFFEGVALVFIIIGMLYYVSCFIKKENPYKK
jgi:hypothetical protein